jgi:dienelactone hydrolase
VALDLAARVDSGGVLLFSPIDSIPRVAARLYPWAPVRWLVQYKFDNLAKAPTINRPVLLVYGAPDQFIPLSDVRALFQEFRAQKRLLKTYGNHHHSGFMDVKALGAALTEFWPSRRVPWAQ